MKSPRGAVCVGTFVLLYASAAIAGEAAAADPADRTALIANLQMPDLDGQLHRLAEWKGQVIALNFWASWCAPCQAEIRTLVDYQNAHGSDGLQIVGIGIDDAQPLRNVQRSLGINYPVLIASPSRQAGIMRDWGNSSGVVPYTVVIDRAGKIAYSHRGPLEREDLDEHVLPLLSPAR